MTGALAGKCAIVTGGAQGIGEAIAELFAAEEARVVIADISDDRGRETARRLADSGCAAHFVHTDLTDADSAQRMAEFTLKTVGQIDVLINNAGIGGVCLLQDMTDEWWHQTLTVNLRGVFLASKFVIPSMIANARGSIVNVGSVYAFVGDRGASAYCASKAGVVMLTRVMATDYAANGIRVNAVCPGFVAGPMTQRDHTEDEIKRFESRHALGRLGRPEEIAQAALFLAGASSSFVTGSALFVDGGYTAW
jgi:NAD(P)-dependent dehydrogenase (short-subunit alcohol dehydrogenase family)